MAVPAECRPRLGDDPLGDDLDVALGMQPNLRVVGELAVELELAQGSPGGLGAYAARRRAVSRADEQPTPITATTAGILIMTLLLL